MPFSSRLGRLLCTGSRSLLHMEAVQYYSWLLADLHISIHTRIQALDTSQLKYLFVCLPSLQIESTYESANPAYPSNPSNLPGYSQHERRDHIMVELSPD